MLGVAGTRHVLKLENYRWIAPLSAFYPDAVQKVDLSAWHPAFPRTSVAATRDPRNRFRVRPDYVAIRSTGGAPSGGLYDWAAVESKVTHACLTNLKTCPAAWTNQAHNVVLTVNDARLAIPRNLVIATRVNPNAAAPPTRCMQIRAWTHRNLSEESRLPQEGAVEIAAASLFGLFTGLRFRENALAIALSVQARAETRHGRIESRARQAIDAVSERAETELHERTREPLRRADRFMSFVASLETARLIEEPSKLRSFSQLSPSPEDFGVH